MISIENLHKSFGGQVLFDGLTFKVNPRERVGLVGRNGHGKTTLFRMIKGEEQPDSGEISLPKHYRIGYVTQEIEFTRNTVLEEGMKGLPEHEGDHHWKVEKVLSGLGFSEADLVRDPMEFSGGYQVRLNLAKVLVSDSDLLLLDEPTNYLDITSIRWIRKFLSEWPRELMLITHDRNFMDGVVTDVVGIHRRKARKIKGNTEKYYSWIAQNEEIYEKTRINDEKKRKEVEQFITRFRAKARLANLVQSRIKTLSKMEKRDKLENLRTLDFSFRSHPFKGKIMLRTEDIRFSYVPGKPLINGLDITVGAGERICIVGPNGKGKTTLIKLLAGLLEPDSGTLQYSPGAIMGFYEQTNVKSLVDSRTIEEEILYAGADIDRRTARNICGAMLFEGDAALKTIGVLSGGEKSRVMLGKLLVTPISLLLLDEPTNHLDLESCDALLSAVDAFEGTVIMVTHNEMFLHALADRLIVFKQDGIEVFDGTYPEFLEKGGWESEYRENGTRPHGRVLSEVIPEEVKPRFSKKELRKMRSAVISEKSRVLKPLETDIEQMENRIEKLEKDLEHLNDAMQKASEECDGPRISEISRSIHSGQSEIDSLFEKLEEVMTLHDEKKAVFDRQLQELEQNEETEDTRISAEGQR